MRFVSALCLAALVFAQQPNREPARAPLGLSNPSLDKNFYLLALIARDYTLKSSLEAVPALREMNTKKWADAKQADQKCPEVLTCFTAPMRFTDAEMTTASDALKNLVQNSATWKAFAATTLRDSGAYVRYHAKSDADLVAAAWLDAARGINRLIDVYGDGKPPRYNEIDSVIFDVKAAGYRQVVHTMLGNLIEQSTGLKLFYEPSLRFSAYLLDANKRDEAGRHEPMETRDNQAVVRMIPSVHWEDYPYTAIVIPGSGGDRIAWNMNISPASKLRAEIAARRWHEHKAPLIITSGGYVHPNQTPFAEAIEMKKVLVEEFGVPASAIIVDPHARHTTTNMRNAARLMYRYGVPFSRKAIVTTDNYQSTYMEGEAFFKRNLDELGYQTMSAIKRLNQFDLEYFPTVDSLQIDPNDPLDP